MAPIIEVSPETLRTLNQEVYIRREDLENGLSKPDLDDFIYVPSTGLYVAKETSLHNKNWFEAHQELQSKGERMPTFSEYREFLKYIREHNPEIYNNITEVRSPWRSEWIDADFKVAPAGVLSDTLKGTSEGKDGELYINSNHILDSNGDVVKYDLEVLDKNTLMVDRTPGISLENWIDSSHTKQGLPSKNVQKGDLYFLNPRSDNNSVARFGANSDVAELYCIRSPSGGDSNLGVRAVREK